MLTESQKEQVIKHICKLVKESIYENGFEENFFPEAKKHEKKDDEDKPKETKSHKDDVVDHKKSIVLQWLDTAQELHSVLSYELWPDVDEDSARSEFSKKYRGEDANHKKYSFTDEEINGLYSMREDFIKRGGLKRTAHS